MAQHSDSCALDFAELQCVPVRRSQQDFRGEELATTLLAARFCSRDCRLSREQKKRISPLEQRHAKCGIPLQAVSGTNARITSCLRKPISNRRYKVVLSKKSHKKPIRFPPMPHCERREALARPIVACITRREQYPIGSGVSERRANVISSGQNLTWKWMVSIRIRNSSFQTGDFCRTASL